MFIKRQYLVTVISIVIILLLTYVLWFSDKNYEYSNLGMSIHIIFGYLIAVVMGIIAIARRPYTHTKNSSVSLYNFIGTFNICISIVGAIFIYVDNGNKISGQLMMFFVTFIIGLFILENIYFNREKSD